MKKLGLIINPNAGHGGYEMGFVSAMRLLASAGYDTTLYFTRAAGDATEIAIRVAKQHDVLACVGGDGTLSEVLSGLMQVQDPPPLGYFPMGTANDVATTLNLPKNDIQSAVRCMLAGSPHPFDVGGFGNDQYFSYIAAFGAFTEVSYETPQEMKRALGHLAYVLAGAAYLPKIEVFRARVEYDGGVIEDDFLYGSLSNSTSVAGIFRLQEEIVELGDGQSELVLIRDPGNIAGINDILASVMTRRYDSDKLIILHTTKAKFTFEKPVAWTRDGEAGGSYREIELCNYPHPVQIIF